jgi:hypothetical protein
MSEKVKELMKWAGDAGSALTDLVRFAALTIADRDAEIERLKAALPYDWNMLEACRGSLREHMAEIKRLKADNERLRGLLREAREYLPEHHPIAESLFPRIDQALQEVPR